MVNHAERPFQPGPTSGVIGEQVSARRTRAGLSDVGSGSRDVDMSLNYQSMGGSYPATSGGVRLPDDGIDSQRRRTPSRSYRGFTTSINGMFQDPSMERVDCCAIACCGVLQSDRDRFLITGVDPPSCARRFWLHTVTPVIVFMAAGYCAFNIRDPYLNQAVCSTLVFCFVGVFVVQCFKGSWKRQSVRRDLLWTKYQLATTGHLHMRHAEESDGNDDSDESSPPFLMGQTTRDIRASHSLCYCYVTDIARLDDRQDIVEGSRTTENVCASIFRCWTRLCCGTLCGMHLQVCGICALAQEGRETEIVFAPGHRRIDYISMQPFMEYYPSIFKARHGEAQVQFGLLELLRRTVTGRSSAANSDGEGLVFILDGLSIVSKGILLSITGFLLILLTWSILSQRLHHSFTIANFIVLCAALLQSLVILLVVYWKHTKDVSADALIKFFSTGFVLCTTLAIFFELVGGLSLRLIMSMLIALSGINEVEENGFQSIFESTPAFGSLGPFGTELHLNAAQSYRDYLDTFGSDHPVIYTIYLFINAYFMAAMIEELCKYFGYRMAADHPDFMSATELEEAIDVYNDLHDESNDSHNEPLEGSYTPQRVVLPCAQQDRSLKSRGAGITVSMVAVSLGFACCENLVYIFLYGDKTLGGEILVLIARSLFPVHPIAAAIQSIGVCGRDIENNPKMTLNRVIGAAVLFHGSYDFFLLWIDFIVSLDGNYVIADDDSVTASDSISDWYSVLVSFAVLGGGLVYYIRESQKQRARFEAVDRESTVDRSHLI